MTGKSSTFGVVLITLAVMKIAIAYVVDLFQALSYPGTVGNRTFPEIATQFPDISRLSLGQVLSEHCRKMR
ncbi:MAG: hypothetical protein F6K21_28825 [Symploca sp. SIO2D2]|nr:hypothetical protein [Symploca sp. SIO2D2]